MKKILLVGIFTAVLLTPSLARAQVSPEQREVILAQIHALLEMVTNLQAQIIELKAAQEPELTREERRARALAEADEAERLAEIEEEEEKARQEQLEATRKEQERQERNKNMAASVAKEIDEWLEDNVGVKDFEREGKTEDYYFLTPGGVDTLRPIVERYQIFYPNVRVFDIIEETQRIHNTTWERSDILRSTLDYWETWKLSLE